MTYSSRTKHVALRFFLRELVKTAEITIYHVGTGERLAKVAANCLDKVLHHVVLIQITGFSMRLSS